MPHDRATPSASRTTDATADSIQEHMQGGGFYNQHSHPQGAANSYGVPLVEEAVAKLGPTYLTDHVAIADYGSAQGRNSLLPMRTAVLGVKGRRSPPPAISVYHTDLPTNDWTTLFETCLRSPDSYMAGQSDVFCFASGTPFYQRIFPPNTIALGYSAIAVHWLQRAPGLIPGQIWSVRAEGDIRRAWTEQARIDWAAFLGHREAELIPSGGLAVVGSGADREGNSGAEALIDAANAILQSMVKDSALQESEYAAMVIPTYYRTEAEWREPFEAGTSSPANSLSLDSYEEVAMPDPYIEAYRQTGDAGAFARAYTAFFLAAYEPSLFGVLHIDRSAESKQGVVDTFTKRLEETLATDPERYSPRWILALLLISKSA